MKNLISLSEVCKNDGFNVSSILIFNVESISRDTIDYCVKTFDNVYVTSFNYFTLNSIQIKYRLCKNIKILFFHDICNVNNFDVIYFGSSQNILTLIEKQNLYKTTSYFVFNYHEDGIYNNFERISSNIYRRRFNYFFKSSDIMSVLEVTNVKERVINFGEFKKNEYGKLAVGIKNPSSSDLDLLQEKYNYIDIFVFITTPIDISFLKGNNINIIKLNFDIDETSMLNVLNIISLAEHKLVLKSGVL